MSEFDNKTLNLKILFSFSGDQLNN